MVGKEEAPRESNANQPRLLTTDEHNGNCQGFSTFEASLKSGKIVSLSYSAINIPIVIIK